MGAFGCQRLETHLNSILVGWRAHPKQKAMLLRRTRTTNIPQSWQIHTFLHHYLGLPKMETAVSPLTLIQQDENETRQHIHTF